MDITIAVDKKNDDMTVPFPNFAERVVAALEPKYADAQAAAKKNDGAVTITVTIV